MPMYVECDQYGSQARFLLAKLNPSVTHNSQNQSASSDFLFTDDVSLQAGAIVASPNAPASASAIVNAPTPLCIAGRRSSWTISSASRCSREHGLGTCSGTLAFVAQRSRETQDGGIQASATLPD